MNPDEIKVPEQATSKLQTDEQEQAESIQIRQGSHKKEKLTVAQIISIVLLILGMVATGILVVVVIYQIIYHSQDQLFELLLIESYLVCFLVLLFLIILYELNKTKQFIWERHDVWGLLICTVMPSVILPCCAYLIIQRITGDTQLTVNLPFEISPHDALMFTIIALFLVFTLAWFVWNIRKNRENKNVRKELLTTAQRMTTIITLIGISCTKLPDEKLNILFCWAGILYTIMLEINNRFALKTTEQIYIVTPTLQDLHYEVSTPSGYLYKVQCKPKKNQQESNFVHTQNADNTPSPSVVVNLAIFTISRDLFGSQRIYAYFCF